MKLSARSAFLALALAAAAPALAEDVVVDVEYGSRARLQALASRFQHVDVRKDGVARFVASRDAVEALRADGYVARVDAAGTARLAAAIAGVSGAKAIPQYACYRTVEETYAAMDAMAATHPQLARVQAIGPSWVKSRNAASGYEMRALVLGNTATDAAFPNKPNMIVSSAIHAREYATAELMTRFAEELVAEYGVSDEATWLLDNFRFHLVLQTNPDGRKRAEGGVLWRKNVNGTNGSCSDPTDIGIDLNRNFPWQWGAAFGSSGNVCAETYRGRSPASEPETSNLVAYIAGTRGSDGVYRGGLLPDRLAVDGSAAPVDYAGLYIDVHSFGGLVLWPWGHTPSPAPNAAALASLGRRMAFLNGHRPQQAYALYATDGTTDDHFYATLGAPGYTLEIGNDFFQDCSVFESSVLPGNRRALRYAARTLPAPYELGNGPVASVTRATPRTVAVGETVAIEAALEDIYYSTANGTEPTHAIASASAYVDVPPWQPGAVAIPLAPPFGTFDGTREAAVGSIPTDGLAPGPHTIYVQGTDATGARGAPAAVSIVVTAPPVSPQTGWYWNAAESGRGFFVERNASDRLFMATFHYLGDGSATWFSAQGAFANGYATSPISTFGSGQTLTGAYVAPVALAASSDVALQFTSDTEFSLTWPAGGVALTRFPFTGGATVEPPRAGAPESGWWWNAAEAGRGFALEFQGDALFMAGFMYGADGRATWYATTGAMQSPTRYTGTWLAFRDGQAPGAPYRAPVRAPDAGDVTLDFQDATHALLTLPDGRMIPLTRFSF